MRKKLWIAIASMSVFTFLGMTTVYANDITEITAPTGFGAVLSLVPLILVLALLFLKVDMIIAGIIAAIVAVVIGGISIFELNTQVLAAIPQMLTITVPIVNSAIATAVFRAGSYTASLNLVNKATKGKLEYVAGFVVLLMGLATYMSGIGGGSAMVIAPLAFAAVGAVPEVIVGMSIAAAVSFTTSPASLETSIASQLAGFEVGVYVDAMRPYWMLFLALAVIIAFVGTKRRKVTLDNREDTEFDKMSMGELAKYTIPAVFLLFAVIVGPIINGALGLPLFTPLNYMIVTMILVVLFTKQNTNETFSSLVDGSSYILTRLFQVGIFLGFINVIAQTGAFAVIANVARDVPPAVVVPVSVIAGFLIGVPAGAYVGSILALVLPVGIALGFSPLAVGFVTMGVGLGSQLAVVNITMQALASGFKVDIIDIVKGNLKYILGCLAILVVLAFVMA